MKYLCSPFWFAVSMAFISVPLQTNASSEQFCEEESQRQQLTTSINWMNGLTNQERLNIIGNYSALHSYQTINESWRYMKIPTDLDTDSICWKPTVFPVKDMQQLCCLLWDYEKEPSIQKAVNSVLNSSTIAECLNASIMVKIKIISNILGAEKMENLVIQLSSKNSDRGSFDFLNRLSWTFLTECEEDFPGVCFMTFVNVESYRSFKPFGNSARHNVIKLSDGTFIGFDPVFFAQPRTYAELERHMYDEFLSPQDVHEEMRAEHDECREDFQSQECGFECFKIFRKEFQAEIKPYRFDVSKIDRFIETGKL